MTAADQHTAPTTREARAERLEDRFTTPVVVAALAAVPATFLSMLEGAAGVVGEVVNWASLAVFLVEAVVLFFVTDHRMAWLRRHAAVVALTAIAVPAVVYAVAPVQALRLLAVVRGVGALRIIRVNRILRAGRVVRRRAGIGGRLATGVTIGVTVLAAVFAALVLADPTSTTRAVLDAAYARLGVAVVVAAGAIVGAATYVVVRFRDADEPDEDRGAMGDRGEGT